MDAESSQNTGFNAFNETTQQEVENLRLQVENLERFKALFFEIEAKLNAGGNSSGSSQVPPSPAPVQPISKPENQAATNQIEQIQSLSSGQEEMVRDLKRALEEMEFEDSKNKSLIEEQLDRLSTFERQLEEAKGCSNMLEQELERLIQENESLANQLEAMAMMPQSSVPPSGPAEADGDITQLKNELQEAENAAYNAMMSCGDLGVVINFFNNSSDCQSIEELSKLTIDSLQAYGVTSTLQLRNTFQTINLSDSGDLEPEMLQLIEQCRQGDRVMEFDDKIIVSHPNVSLVAESLPSDELRASSIRDNLVTLMGGVDGTVRAMELKQKNDQQRSGMVKLISSTKDALSKVDQSFKSIESNSGKVMQNLIDQMNQTLSQVEITDEAARFIQHIIQMGQSQVEGIHKNNVRIDKQFAEIINKLEKSISKMG